MKKIKLILTTILSTILVSGIIYAAGVLTTLESGNVITADNWNAMVDEITALKSASGGSASSGAVISFNLSNCPDGWSEYLPAQGRFIRGIDKTGTNIDPDGERGLESIQEDEIKSHNHNISTGAGRISSTGTIIERGWLEGTSRKNIAIENAGGLETRPKNIALLYCVKN